MSKTIQHFLFGFGSVLNMFGTNKNLQLSSSRFKDDLKKRIEDANKVKIDFLRIASDS